MAVTTREDLLHLDQQAHDESVRLSAAQQAQLLQSVLGQRLTAIVAGINDPKAVGKWARGERTPHPDQQARLRQAYRIVTLLGAVERPQTIRAWFLGMNPGLDDRAPVLVLGKEPARVLQAARSFLANG